ncbi:hypothetical protein, partial [Citrobacter freundii]|uniref:hypothetical protein n=1 Tax=Citrobacter freundii TaxID=546 RepID=UPI001CE23ABD
SYMLLCMWFCVGCGCVCFCVFVGLFYILRVTRISFVVCSALSAEFTIGEGELMAHDVPLGCAPDEYDDLISGTCSHLP